MKTDIVTRFIIKNRPKPLMPRPKNLGDASIKLEEFLSSCDRVGELVAAFEARESVCYCSSDCWADISFSHLKRGSTVEGTGKGLT